MINFNHMFNNKLIMWLDLIIWLSKFNTVLVLTTSWTTDPRCLAVHRGTPNVQALEAPIKTYYRQQDMTPAYFKGVTLDDLVVLGQIFRLNVYVYDLQKTEAGDITTRLVRRSPYSFEDTMNLNLYEDHFSYVRKKQKLMTSQLGWYDVLPTALKIPWI